MTVRKLMSKIEAYTEWMENLAKDDYYGYQWGGWGPRDYDCGHAVITALQTAGIPAKDHGATYTGNMRPVLLELGFKDVTAGVNLDTGSGLKRGDILLNHANHVAVYTGSKQLVHARSSEGNSIPGDQNGREVCIQDYFNYPWDCVLRYPEVVGADEPPEVKPGLTVDGECGPATWAAIMAMLPKEDKLPLLKRGSKGSAVRFLQAMLDYFGANLDIDGDFGRHTEKELKEFQKGGLQ